MRIFSSIFEYLWMRSGRQELGTGSEVGGCLRLWTTPEPGSFFVFVRECERSCARVILHWLGFQIDFVSVPSPPVVPFWCINVCHVYVTRSGFETRKTCPRLWESVPASQNRVSLIIFFRSLSVKCQPWAWSAVRPPGTCC